MALSLIRHVILIHSSGRTFQKKHIFMLFFRPATKAPCELEFVFFKRFKSVEGLFDICPQLYFGSCLHPINFPPVRRVFLRRNRINLIGREKYVIRKCSTGRNSLTLICMRVAVVRAECTTHTSEYDANSCCRTHVAVVMRGLYTGMTNKRQPSRPAASCRCCGAAARSAHAQPLQAACSCLSVKLC